MYEKAPEQRSEKTKNCWNNPGRYNRGLKNSSKQNYREELKTGVIYKTENRMAYATQDIYRQKIRISMELLRLCPNSPLKKIAYGRSLDRLHATKNKFWKQHTSKGEENALKMLRLTMLHLIQRKIMK